MLGPQAPRLGKRKVSNRNAISHRSPKPRFSGTRVSKCVGKRFSPVRRSFVLLISPQQHQGHPHEPGPAPKHQPTRAPPTDRSPNRIPTAASNPVPGCRNFYLIDSKSLPKNKPRKKLLSRDFEIYFSFKISNLAIRSAENRTHGPYTIPGRYGKPCKEAQNLQKNLPNSAKSGHFRTFQGYAGGFSAETEGREPALLTT